MTDKCPDDLLPGGDWCPRCGGERAPSGVDGGSWVHYTPSPQVLGYRAETRRRYIVERKRALNATMKELFETPESIAHWAEETFGAHTNPMAGVCRIQAELTELALEAGKIPQDREKIANEIADVLICVYRYAYCQGVDINEAVAAKMAINRGRLWKRNGDGTGQHIKHDRLDCT